jgi:hypothetical protein
MEFFLSLLILLKSKIRNYTFYDSPVSFQFPNGGRFFENDESKGIRRDNEPRLD